MQAVVSVIKVENIGKRYRVGELEAGGLLRDQIASAFRNPSALLRRKPRETFWALRDISFEVKEGEVLGLIGRNGAGKSTLLKILSRITAPTTGRAEIHGRVGSLLEVGTGFHPELTGRENVFLNGAILGMGKREIARKFDEIVAFAEVERFIDTPVKRYSSGMYVRLAFAVAAHLETEVLFVDEVLSVGDVQFQKKCLGKMGDVARHGRTVIFVSHEMNSIRRLCNRVVWIEASRVRKAGDTPEVVADYEVQMLARRGSPNTQCECFLQWSLEGSENVLHDGMGTTTLCLDFFLKEPISRGHLGVNIFTDADVLVGGWGFDDLNVAQGHQTLRMTVPFLPLKPGIYWLRGSLFNRGGNLSEGELVERWVSSEPLVVDAPPRAHSQERWSGLLNIPAQLSTPTASEGGDRSVRFAHSERLKIS